jgi:hypothetical protein
MATARQYRQRAEVCLELAQESTRLGMVQWEKRAGALGCSRHALKTQPHSTPCQPAVLARLKTKQPRLSCGTGAASPLPEGGWGSVPSDDCLYGGKPLIPQRQVLAGPKTKQPRCFTDPKLLRWTRWAELSDPTIEDYDQFAILGKGERLDSVRRTGHQQLGRL